MEYKTNQFGAIVKDKFTRSYLSFSNEIQQSELFILMFNIGGYYIENNKEQAKQSLIDIYNHDTNEFAKSLVNYFRSSTADHLFNIRTYQQFYGQMAYARSIDNVVAYFKDILAEVILKTPQVLRSKETERLDFILAFDSISLELICSKQNQTKYNLQ
jgi:hypothetical protein